MSVPSQTQAVGDRLLLVTTRAAAGRRSRRKHSRASFANSCAAATNISSSIWPGVTAIDSAGIRALVRGHTSAQRAGGSLRLAAARPAVSKVLELSHLASVFESYESVDAARLAAWPWKADLGRRRRRAALRGAWSTPGSSGRTSSPASSPRRGHLSPGGKPTRCRSPCTRRARSSSSRS